MKSKMISLYMDMCDRIAQMSVAERAKVGALVVNNNNILSFGWNGTPDGWDNECEHEGKTKPEVLHAESNALMKVAKSTQSSEGATLFCTHLPCMDCAKLIYQSGIAEVYYKVEYNAAKGAGKEFLIKSGVDVKQCK